jgi:hypothetical protein
MKIAVINSSISDGLARTIFDGLLELQKKQKDLQFFLSSRFDYILPLKENILPKEDFINFAHDADLIFLIWGKGGVDYNLAEKIGKWEKTIFIDGSEVGKDRRYDFSIQQDILNGQYIKNGAIDQKMLKLCALYFRREKPYVNGIIPLPFGIESFYLSQYDKNIKKSIDFHCVFGQDEYPKIRKYATKILEKYCQENGFSCYISKVKSREEFYRQLAKSKVGVSIGGGGFDSMRFWEILGNNCLLLTEKIDIFHPDSKRLNYKRIWEFGNLYDFRYQLDKVSEFLRKKYRQEELGIEYKKILDEHSSVSRVLEILRAVRKK